MKAITLLLFTLSSYYYTSFAYNAFDLIETHKCTSEDVLNPLKWDSAMEKRLAYPRGDKQKLVQISNAWCRYYECAARVASTLARSKRMPSTILTVYRGATAHLSCELCVAPGELTQLVWTYAKSTENTTFAPLTQHHHILHEGSGITIYHVDTAHAGVYRCEMERSVSGLVILRVVDDEEYTVVKPTTSLGPYPSQALAIDKDLTAFTSWSNWSECSSCGKVGRRRRYGMCYVKMTRKILNEEISPLRTEMNKTIHQITVDVFEDFPDGIPCRSVRLPVRIRELTAVKQRRNEIMIAMCKVPCKNNSNVDKDSASIRPLPGREIQFVVHGDPVKIQCPGSTLCDMPVSWRVGAEAIIPRTLDERSEGRIHLNARDHLVFTEVLYSDSHLYSCWQGERLAGTVKLVVWCGEHTIWNHRTLLVVVVVAAGAVSCYLDRVLYNRQR